MLMAVKILLFLMIAYGVPYLLGMLYTFIFKKSEYNLCINLINGYVLLWAFLQIVTIPSIYLKIQFSTYAIIIYALLLIVVLCSLVLNRKRLVQALTAVFAWLKSKPWLMLIIILLVVAQTGYLTMANLVDYDDSLFVAISETALETNTLMEYSPYTGVKLDAFMSKYVLSPFPMFTALFANLLNIRAATVAHTLFILALVPLAYSVWYLTGREFYGKNDKKIGIFMLIIMCILVFSGYSVYTPGMFLNVRIWQGKAILASTLLPLLFCFGLRILKKEMKKSDWILLFAAMLSACYVSSMGIMLGIIMLGIIAIADAIIHKSLSNWKNLIICCLPNAFFAITYIFIR